MKQITFVETHTGGQPTRTVLRGVLQIPGATMWDKYHYMEQNGDWLRKIVCEEPRGSEIMSGTILTEACSPEADVGILHFEAAGWLPMCGHNTIGACTAMVELGLVDAKEPETPITIETPLGLIRATVEVKNGAAEKVRFRNAPAFPLLRNASIRTDEFGELPLNIGWGGSAVAFIEAKHFGLSVCRENVKQFEALANKLRPQINAEYPINHPALPNITGVSHVAFYEDGEIMKHVVVGPDGHCDRSPCGNGTCARAALLFAEGKLKAGDSFEQHSIIDSVFTCKCVETTTVGDTEAIIPEISGQAWITAFTTAVLKDTDTLGAGFLLI